MMSTRQRAPERFSTPDLVVKETGRFVPEQQAYLNIVRTAQVLGADLAELLSRHGLSGKQYNVLRAIRRGGKPGLTASQISEQMTDRGADVTRLVDRLVRDGSVDRRHDEADRRVVRASLTARGAKRLRALDAPLIERHRGHLGHLSAKEIDTLIALLKKARRQADD